MVDELTEGVARGARGGGGTTSVPGRYWIEADQSCKWRSRRENRYVVLSLERSQARQEGKHRVTCFCPCLEVAVIRGKEETTLGPARRTAARTARKGRYPGILEGSETSTPVA